MLILKQLQDQIQTDQLLLLGLTLRLTQECLKMKEVLGHIHLLILNPEHLQEANIINRQGLRGLLLQLGHKLGQNVQVQPIKGVHKVDHLIQGLLLPQEVQVLRQTYQT